MVSPLYVPVIVADPAVDGVKATEQDETWPEPATNVQLAELNVPDGLAVKLTVPVGAAVVRLEIPCTVAVQVEA